MRTASFGLALLYAALMAGSVMIIGAVVYWTIEASLERQMTARIDAEIDLFNEELKSEGDSELVEEVQRRSDVLPLEYLLVDAKDNRIAGNLPVTPKSLGWSDIQLPTQRSGTDLARTFHIHSVELSKRHAPGGSGRLWRDRRHAPGLDRGRRVESHCVLSS